MTYEIRVRGVVTPELATALGGTVRAGHESVLHAPVDDQTALYQVLDRIYGFGLQLIGLRAVGTDEIPA